MNALSEFERWRERLLDEYQHAQIIDRLDKQRLLDEYQRAQAIDRLDQQNASLSRLGSILADTGSSVGLVQADIARLLAVTDQALPVIVDHLALVGTRLDKIEHLLASPRETEARELFRSGFRALTSAIEMSEKGSQGLADDWLDESISDLSRAVDTCSHRPEFWFQLGVAHAFRGPSEDAAEAFSHCSRYAVSDSPPLAAASVLLAAEQFRSIGQQTKARDLLRKFSRPLERCAEIHLNLAIYHGESDRWTRGLELAPKLAADASVELKDAGRTKDLDLLEKAAAEVCRYDDGPVSLLRALESAIYALIDAAKKARLNGINDPLAAVALPSFGVDALLIAEVNIHLVAERGKQFANNVMSGLAPLEAQAQDCWQSFQETMTSGAVRIRKAQEQAALAKKQAQQTFTFEAIEARLANAMRQKDGAEGAHRQAERNLQEAISKGARHAIEFATARVQATHQSVRRWTEIAEAAERQLTGGEARRKLQECEQEAERTCQRIVQQVKEEVRSAELEYYSARHAIKVMAGFLRALDTAIENATASRNRIIPSI